MSTAPARPQLWLQAVLTEVAQAFDLGEYEMPSSASRGEPRNTVPIALTSTIPPPPFTAFALFPDEIKRVRDRDQPHQLETAERNLDDDASWVQEADVLGAIRSTDPRRWEWVLGGYTAFRKEIEGLTRPHTSALRNFVDRAADQHEAERLVRLETETPGHPDLEVANTFTAALGKTLGTFRLVNHTDERGPLLGPFAAAIALGLGDPMRGWLTDVPGQLRPPYRLAGGSFTQGVAYHHLRRRVWSERPHARYREPTVRDLVRIGLSSREIGRGRVNARQIRGAYWWVVVRLGTTPTATLASLVGVDPPDVRKAVAHFDRLLAGQPIS